MDVSEKETRAIFLNFKELRCLEKKSQMLDVEKAYSLSLINLDQKVVQVSYKQFTEKVARIRSHLSFDDIQQLKRLEYEGRLGLPPTTAKLDSNMRIRAASKRLKLLPRSQSAVPRLSTCTQRASIGEPARLFKSATPRMSRYSARELSAKPKIVVSQDSDIDSNSLAPKSVREARRKSIDFSAIDSSGAPMMLISQGKSHSGDSPVRGSDGKDNTKRSDNRLQLTSHGNQLSPRVLTNNYVGDTDKTVDKQTIRRGNGAISPNNSLAKGKLNQGKDTIDGSIRASRVSMSSAVEEAVSDNKNRRMSLKVSNAIGMRKKSVVNVNAASKLLSEGKTRSPFSSHDTDKKKRSSKDDKPFRSIRDGKLAGIENNKLDIGENLYKQLKQGLIMSEEANNLMLEDRIDSFLGRMEDYLADTQKAETEQIQRLKDTIEMLNRRLKGEKIRKPRKTNRRKGLEDRYKNQGNKGVYDPDSMKDVNQCRYLRVPDEMIDLTGVNTLVADQMKMAFILKHGDDEDSD